MLLDGDRLHLVDQDHHHYHDHDDCDDFVDDDLDDNNFKVDYYDDNCCFQLTRGG